MGPRTTDETQSTKVHSHSKGEEQHPPVYPLISRFSPLFCDPFSSMFSPSHKMISLLTIWFLVTGQPNFRRTSPITFMHFPSTDIANGLPHPQHCSPAPHPHLHCCSHVGPRVSPYSMVALDRDAPNIHTSNIPLLRAKEARDTVR